jgi:hypothetical protein
MRLAGNTQLATTPFSTSLQLRQVTPTKRKQGKRTRLRCCFPQSNLIATWLIRASGSEATDALPGKPLPLGQFKLIEQCARILGYGDGLLLIEQRSPICSPAVEKVFETASERSAHPNRLLKIDDGSVADVIRCG